MSILLFLTAILLSGIAAYYSVIGLIAIFSAAVIPVAIMGGSLEIAKLVVASWLYRYWNSIPLLMKTYFTSALAVLMLITSMGIFGFLSKAHNDQSLVSGEVLSKIAIYDEKIKTAKDNIEANRKALKQLDEAVDQVMARSTSEEGADKSVALRRQQANERARLLKEITVEQKTIVKLNEEAAPIRAEVRKVEAEVGPIKYIAALIYGDNPDANLLERAVRWLIILLICVFDPLAVLMLIAANLTQIKQSQLRQEKQKTLSEPKVEPPKAEIVAEPVQVDEAVKVDTVEPKKKDKKPVKKKFSSVEEKKQAQPVEVTTPKEVPTKIVETPPKVEAPAEQTTQDKLISEAKETEPKQVSIETQVQEMIDNNDSQSLEAIYKKIVKELAKKNRAKSTHWGPLR